MTTPPASPLGRRRGVAVAVAALLLSAVGVAAGVSLGGWAAGSEGQRRAEPDEAAAGRTVSEATRPATGGSAPAAVVDRRSTPTRAPDTQVALAREVARLRGTESWFGTLPAVLTSYSTDTRHGRLIVDVSSADPDVAGRILARFGWTEDLVTIRSDGTGLLLLPRGTLRIVVRDAGGRPVRGLRCLPDTATPEAAIGLIQFARTDSRGACTLPRLVAATYSIRVVSDRDGPRRVVAYRQTAVLANRTTTLIVRV